MQTVDTSKVSQWLVFPHLRTDYRQFWVQTQTAIRAGRLADAIAIGRMFASQPGAPNIIRYGFGCLLMMAGEFDQGRKVVADIGSFQQGSAVYRTSFFGYEPSNRVTLPLVSDFSLNRSLIDHWRTKDVLVCSACDLRYFRAFYEKLIRSVKGFHPSVHGIVFLVTNDDQEFDEAKRLVELTHLDSIIPIRLNRRVLDSTGLRVAYACARWTALDMLVDHFRTGQKLLILDVDMVQVSNANEQLFVQNSDVNLLLYPSEIMNLVAYVSGSLAICSVNDRSRIFLKQVSNVINIAFDQKLIDWHLDQFALLVGYLNSPVVKYSILDQASVLSEPFAGTEKSDQKAIFRSRTASLTGTPQP